VLRLLADIPTRPSVWEASGKALQSSWHGLLTPRVVRIATYLTILLPVLTLIGAATELFVDGLADSLEFGATTAVLATAAVVCAVLAARAAILLRRRARVASGIAFDRSVCGSGLRIHRESVRCRGRSRPRRVPPAGLDPSRHDRDFPGGSGRRW
jgi:hypothetical protein